MNPWLDDLKFLLSEIKRIHPDPYHKNSEENWNEVLKEVQIKLQSDIPDHLKIVQYYRVMSLLADSHSQINLTFSDDHNKMSSFLPDHLNFSYPVYLMVFDDGLFITKAKNPDILGKKVISINDTDISLIAGKLKPFLPVENEIGFILYFPLYLRKPIFLEGIGLITGPKEIIELQFEDKTSTLLQAESNPELIDIFEFQKSQNNDISQNEFPIYLQTKPSLSIVETDENLIVNIRSIQDSQELSMKQLAEKLDEKLESNKPSGDSQSKIKRLIIDIRNNGGGDNHLNQPLVRTIIKHSWIDYPGKLFVLTNRRTFSAAINLALDFEKWTWAIFVGEPFSGKINHYGDSTLFDLPNSGLKVRLSTLFWQDSDPTDNRETIMPDIPAILTYKDYENKIDTCLNVLNDYKLDDSWHEFYKKYSPRHKRYRLSQKNNIETFFT